MNLNELQQHWDRFGKDDPMWAIITRPGTKGNKWNEEEFFQTGRNRINKEIRQLTKRYPDFKLERALDFGCGIGRLTQGLAGHFDEVHGIDIAPSMIELANKMNKHQKKCTYHLNPKNDLSLFPNNHFNLVFSIITLQHMRPQYAKHYLAEFIRVLKPGGMLTFQIPSKPDEKTRKRKTWIKKTKSKVHKLLNPGEYAKDPIMEMYWIPIEETIRFLRENGVVIDRIQKDNAAGNNWESYTYYAIKSS